MATLLTVMAVVDDDNDYLCYLLKKIAAEDLQRIIVNGGSFVANVR